MMTPFSAVVMFTLVFATGMMFFAWKKINDRLLKLSISFTGSFLFTISMVQLLPEVFSRGSSHVGYFILAGFFLQLVLEYFSEGIEHGHQHHHHHHGKGFPMSMMAGLCVHSFLEGMPLSGNFTSQMHGHSLLTGIILHHLPVAFILVSMLSQSGISKTWTIINLVIFAAMAPAGAWFSSYLSSTALLNIGAYFDEIMGLVIGIFLHISTTILFETGSDHRFNLYKLSVIALGALVALMW